ncbi:hypothetical protein [Streptomyces sp. NPDC059783]|uniref:hypothetical protein n=1 Tax=Streptomyces sp. NPDC059783 TaxID=3346944 RepID=UPI00365D5F28
MSTLNTGQGTGSTIAPTNGQSCGPDLARLGTDALVMAERCPWALAAPGARHWPDGFVLDTTLSAVRPEDQRGYVERLEAFTVQHRDRLEGLLRAYGPGSRPASHGRYALVGQPETLVILERMEAVPFLLRGRWDRKEEGILLDDLEYAWSPRIRLSRP